MTDGTQHRKLALQPIEYCLGAVGTSVVHVDHLELGLAAKCCDDFTNQGFDVVLFVVNRNDDRQTAEVGVRGHDEPGADVVCDRENRLALPRVT